MSKIVVSNKSELIAVKDAVNASYRYFVCSRTGYNIALLCSDNKSTNYYWMWFSLYSTIAPQAGAEIYSRVEQALEDYLAAGWTIHAHTTKEEALAEIIAHK